MSDQINSLAPRRGNPAWRAGGPSPNPGGRPRRGQSLADVLRAKCSAEWIADRLRELAETAESEQVRLAALQQISDRTAGKVTDRLELSRGEPDDDDDFDLSALDLDQLRQLEALEVERDRILAGAGRLALPSHTDGTRLIDVPDSIGVTATSEGDTRSGSPSVAATGGDRR